MHLMATATKTEKALLRERGVGFNGDKPIGIAFISDQHINEHDKTGWRRMMEDADKVRQTPGLYAVLGGDAVDNHCAITAAMLLSGSRPSREWEMFEEYLGVFGQGKVLLAVGGNHDLWTRKLTGYDPAQKLCKLASIPYFPHEGFLKLIIGKNKYIVGVRHKFRCHSMYNETHAVKQWLRFGDVRWHVGVLSHHHKSAIEVFYDGGEKRIAVRPGSYQTETDFAVSIGAPRAMPLCPVVVFMAGRHEMVPFAGLTDEATRFLQLVRGGKNA